VAGRLTGLARGNGAVTTYGYDGADRLLQARTTTPNGAQQSVYQRTVDQLGQPTILTETTALTPLPNGGVPAGGGGGMMNMVRSTSAPSASAAFTPGALADPWAAPLTAPAVTSAPAASSAARAVPAIPASSDSAPSTPATRRRATGSVATRAAGPALRAAGLGLRFEANRGRRRARCATWRGGRATPST